MILERLLRITTSTNPGDRAATYAGCLVAVAVAIAVRAAAGPLLGSHHNYVFFYPVVFGCAFVAGWRGGLLASVVSAIAGYWLMIGEERWRADSSAGLAAALFLANGALATLMIAGMWRAIEELGRERGRAEARAALHAELFGDLNARTGHFLKLVSDILSEQSRQEARAGAANALTEAAGHAALLARVHSEAAGAGAERVELEPFLTEVLKARFHVIEFRGVEGPAILVDREEAVSLGVVLLSYLAHKGEGLRLALGLDRRGGKATVSLRTVGGDGIALDAPGPLVRSMLKQLRGRIELELDGLSLEQLLTGAAPAPIERSRATLH